MSDLPLHRPAAWHPQKEILMSWPGLEGLLREIVPEKLERITRELTAVAGAIAHFQPVTLYVGEERYDEAVQKISELETPFNITVEKIQGRSLGISIRDFGPTFVIKQDMMSLAGVDFNFNGWGRRYITPTTEDFVSKSLQHLKVERIKASIVAEGGTLETDGDGTLIITASSIKNDNRNPGKSREEIEEELCRTLGVSKIIWLAGQTGLGSNDCHTSNLVRFVRPGELLLSKVNEVNEGTQTVAYQEALEVLSNATDAKGRPFEILEIEEPDPEMFEPSKDIIVRSYTNFVFVNGGIILPQFGDPAHDAAAIRTAQRLWGDERRIFPVLIEILPNVGRDIYSSTLEVPQT